MSVRVNYEVLKVWKLGSNACDTKRRTVRGSWLLEEEPGVASGRGWSCERDVIQRMN